MANPIRRIVQLVFDQSSAKKTETQAKGTISRIGGALGGLKKQALALGTAMAAAFSVRAMFRFGKEAVRVAAEADGIWTRLAGTINNAGGNFEAMEGRIRNMARAMQDATTVGDEDFAATFQELLSTSQDVEGSLEAVSVAADLAAAKNIDLRTAAQLVGRAMVGQTSTLTRYGIVIAEGADAMEVLRDQFKGMAANEAQSLEGQMKQLSNEWSDFKQAVGNAIIEAGDGGSVLQSLTATVRTMTEWLDENRQEVAKWGQVTIATVKAVALVFSALVRVAFNTGEIIGRSISSALLSIRQGTATTVNAILSAMDKIPGVDIEFRMNQLTPEQFKAEQDAITDAIIQDYKDMASAVTAAGSSVIGIGEAARASRPGTTGISSNISTREGREPTGSGAPDPDALKEANRLANEALSITQALRNAQEIHAETVARLNLHLEAGRISQETYNRGIAEADRILKEATKSTDAVAAALMGHQEAMAGINIMETGLGDGFDALQAEAVAIQNTLQALANEGVPATDEAFAGLVTRLGAVKDAMVAAGDESNVLSEVASTAGDVVGAAFGAGIGRLAEGKARQNAILSAEQLAHGFAALLNPFTAPKAAGHFAAAGKYGAIAAAWKTLGASIGGGGGGGGSGPAGGGGGAPGTTGDIGGPATEGFDPTAPEVHITFVGEGFQAVNPTVQRVVAGAEQMARERFGENARVRIHRNEGG